MLDLSRLQSQKLATVPFQWVSRSERCGDDDPAAGGELVDPRAIGVVLALGFACGRWLLDLASQRERHFPCTRIDQHHVTAGGRIRARRL